MDSLVVKSAAAAWFPSRVVVWLGSDERGFSVPYESRMLRSIYGSVFQGLVLVDLSGYIVLEGVGLHQCLTSMAFGDEVAELTDVEPSGSLMSSILDPESGSR